ncbi:MAG: VPLPA-CTERM-specific exosortase XrtD, partial [Propionivibrio sp.]
MQTPDVATPKYPGLKAGLVLLVVVLVAAMFWDSFVEMERLWQQPEYSHGYLIPFLAAYLFLIRCEQLVAASPRPAWSGVWALVAAMLVLLAGELSALFVITQYAFLLTMGAIALAFFGYRGLRAIWASLAMLVFLVPLPVLIQYKLSSGLQFISTDLAAWFLRAVGFAVFVEGNVIDLGVSKLQVVEACSGLRYLFPLMCFGFICGYVYRGPRWQRLLILASTIPITIVMNSFRIAVTGILYNTYGIGAGDTFLHYFEGWVIFVGCLLLLFMEMIILAKLQGRKLDDVFDPQLPSIPAIRAVPGTLHVAWPSLAVVVVLALGLVGVITLSGRSEVLPDRQSLVSFPLRLGDWSGTETEISPEELDVLKLTDYVSANYANERGDFVNLYVAYYASQRQGASVHSPRACLPGGGWKILDSKIVKLPGILPDGSDLEVNQLVIGTGRARQLVNYWFMQRGRDLTSEYAVKWYIFWDSITRRRTDGALVRLVTPLPEEGGEEQAAQRLAELTRLAEPRLYYHIPQESLIPA